jgi:hypothetical protein
MWDSNASVPFKQMDIRQIHLVVVEDGCLLKIQISLQYRYQQPSGYSVLVLSA